MKLILLLLLLAFPREVTRSLEETYVLDGTRISLLSTVLAGEQETPSLEGLRLFPMERADGSFSWHAAGEPLPPEAWRDPDFWAFAQEAPALWQAAVTGEDWAAALQVIGRIQTHQEAVLGAYLPPQRRVRAELLWGRLATPRIPFMLCLALGLLLFLLYGRVPAGLRKAVWVFALLLWGYLTLIIGLRWYLVGYGPFAGAYNVMLLMAWLSALGILLGSRRFPVVQPAGLLLAGFTLLLATRAGARLTPLPPGLQSPLLSVHVLCMMLAYTLLGLVAFQGLLGLFARGKDARLRLMDSGRKVLVPAWLVLLTGTILGAVWAQSAWGSWWSWDPKETWALVTLLVYAAFIGCTEAGLLKKPVLFHLLAILAFASVLFTYFGVRLWLGGLHVYA